MGTDWTTLPAQMAARRGQEGEKADEVYAVLDYMLTLNPGLVVSSDPTDYYYRLPLDVALQACAPHAVIYQLADPEYPQVFEARACNGWHTPDQQARVLMQAWGMTQQNPWFSVVQELERTRTMLGVPAVPPHAAASSQHQQPAAPAPQPARQLGGGQRGGAQQQSSTRGGPRQQGGFAELMRGKLASAPVVPISQGIQPFQRVLDACREMGFSWSFTGEWTTLPDPEGISQPLIFAALEELGKGDAAVLGALEVVDLLLDCNPSLVLSRSDASDSHYLLPVDVALRALGAREVYAPRACNQWFSLDQYAWVLIQGAGLAGDERWSNLFLQLNAFRTGLGIPAAQPGRPAASQQQQQRVHSSWAAPPAAQQPPRQQHAAAPSQQQQGGFAELMRAKLAPPDQRRLEDWQALHDAAQTGSARLLREILPRHTWSEAELRAVAIDAAVVGRSWPAVQEVLRHWGAPGLESLVHTVENGAGSGTEHIVFRLVQDAAENRSKGYVCDIVAILQHFAAACPAILHMRDAAGANHPARATVQHGAPLEVVHALAPYAERATWSAATGPRSRASTPLQLAHQMTRQYSRRSQTPNQAWELYYLSVAKYLAGHDAQYAQEMRQAQEAGIERLREQARALEAAVEAGDVESDLRHKVFRGSGFKGFLESCLPKAGRLDMVNAFLDAARESGAPDLPPLHKLAPTLLSNALRSGKAELALQIVKELPEAVHSLQRPPLVPTIAAGATVELIEVLIGVLVEVCQKRGGSFADEPEHSEGKLSPVLAAIKYKRSDVLEKLLEHSTRPAIIEVGRVKWTPLAFAIAEEQAIAARRLLRHAHQRLGPPPDKPAADSSRLRKYLDAACDGAPALLRAVESLPDSGLPTALLVAGADPSVYGRGKADKKTTALHAAIRAGDSALARRMLEALAPAKLNVLADSHGLLPLHAAIRSKDVELVKALLNKGANPVPATAGSPLLDALRQHREEPTQATATVRDALLAGWTAQRTLAALGPQLGESDRQLVAAFLASQRSVTLAPFLRMHLLPGTLLPPQDKKARVELLQGAVDELNAPLLELLCEQPGLNTEGVKLHGAVGSPDVAGSGLPVPLIQRLLAAGCRLNQRDGERGALLVHKAVEKANMELLQLLLGLGSEASSIGARDALGHTLMHYASRDAVGWGPADGDMQTVEGLPPASRVSLRFAGVRSSSACTPWAPTNKREDFVRFLFDLRPSLVNVKNARGETPAFYTNHKRTIRLLAELAESINDSLPPEAVDTEAAASSSKRPLQEDDDLSQPGPAVEPEARKRQRIDAMLAKLPAVWEAVQAQAQQAASAAAAQAAPETQLAGGREFSEVVAETVANVLPEGADADAAELAAAAAEAEGAFSGDEADDLEVAAEVARLATANAPVEDLLKPDAAALGELLLCVEFTITRDAFHSWWAMSSPYRKMVLRRLEHIGLGLWARDKKTKRITTPLKSLELWSSKLTRGGRIVFEVAADWSENYKEWKEMLRIWCITLDHKRYEVELARIQESHRKSATVQERLKLVPAPAQARFQPAGSQAGQRRLPISFRAQGEVAEGREEGGGGDGGDGAREHYPPTSAGEAEYTLLKFYNLSADLVRAVLCGAVESDVDFPFRRVAFFLFCSLDRPGKTTVAVFRMWGRWLAAWQQGQPFHQVFLTASATLQDQVAKSFARLRAAAVPADVAEQLAEAARREYGQPARRTTARPFFPRRADGSILWDRSEGDFDPDGMSVLMNLNPDAELEFEEELEEESEEEEEEAASAAGARPQARWKIQELTFPSFCELWGDITDREARGKAKPGLVWTEILSFIKARISIALRDVAGSAEAVQFVVQCMKYRRLSLEEYLEVGRKRAPNFDADSRRVVFRIYETYERVKRQRWRYDNADVVAHVYRQLAADGYAGAPIHNLYRDELAAVRLRSSPRTVVPRATLSSPRQDFTQAELLMDLRVVSDPNGIFLCGDTAQTIARGIGFRFTDIQTLFFEERRDQVARLAAGDGNDEVAEAVQMPVIKQLQVNYRTHSGILDMASSVVDVLKRFFPMHIDPLARERAFLPATSAEDLAMLLSWSDKSASQVEFGAHQIVLTRNMESRECLPEVLANSNALFLTVPQSKGLEFDDVFCVNFFSESVCKEEWRVLLQYLEELEELEAASGAGVLPTKRHLLDPGAAAKGIGELGKGPLRPLPFDPAAHKLLCEELKHLYTAITRAKNSVIIFDANEAARAPFYYFIRRLGLGRMVTRTLMEASGGMWLLDTGLYDSAATCFERAEDPARASYCRIRGRLNKARLAQEQSPSEARALWFSAAYDLLGLVVNGQPCPELAPPVPSGKAGAAARVAPLEAERRLWASMAARAFQTAGERETAVRLFLELGSFKAARQLLVQIGDPLRLAAACEAAVRALERDGRAEQALLWLEEAVKQYALARRHDKCVVLVDQSPDILLPLRRKRPDLVQEIGVAGMQQCTAAKDREGAIRASRLVADHGQRCLLLQQHGLWEELAAITNDPLQAAEWLAESSGYPAAADRLLAALEGAAASPAAVERMLRVAHRYVVAAGSGVQVRRLWDVLALVTAQTGAQFAAEVGMEADLVLRVAHQAAGLDPATGLPASGGLDAAKYLAAALRAGPPPPAARDAEAAGAGLAAELAHWALGHYQSASHSLGGLRCVAVLCHLGAALSADQRAAVAKAFAPTLTAADLLFSAALGSAAAGPRAGARGGAAAVFATPELQRAAQQLGAALGLAGLSKPGAVSVTCPLHDPCFPALVKAFSAASRSNAGAVASSSNAGAVASSSRAGAGPQQGQQLQPPQVALHKRTQAGATQLGGAPGMPTTVLAADATPARQAVAWWVHRLATTALVSHLRWLGAAAPGSAALPVIKALTAAGDELTLVGRVREFDVACCKRLPALAQRGPGARTYAQTARLSTRQPAGSPLEDEMRGVEGALLERLANAAFPSGPVDEVAPQVLKRFRAHLPCEQSRFADWAEARFLSRAHDEQLANPDLGFDAFRHLALVIGDPRRCARLLAKAVPAKRSGERLSKQEQVLLARVDRGLQHPACLLGEALEKFPVGAAATYSACDGLLFYLERTYAVAEAQQRGAAARPGEPRARHLSVDRAAWLLELLSGLGCLACGVELPAVFLPQPAAELLQSLPSYLSEDLVRQAALLGKLSPEQAQRVWRHLACLLAATIQRAGAAVDASARGESLALDRRSPEQAVAARLLLAAGSLLASLAVRSHYGASKGLEPEVPGALYAAVEAASRVPALAGHAEAMAGEERLGRLVLELKALASALGTSVVQVQFRDGKVQPFDGFPRAGTLSQLARQPVVFRARALKAAAAAVQLPGLEDEYAPDTTAEERKAAAALVIQAHWRRHRERHAHRKQGRRERRAIRRLRLSTRFREGVRRWVGKLRERQRYEQERQRELQELLHRKDMALSMKAGFTGRYNWMEDLVDMKGLVSVEECDVCPQHVPAPAPGPVPSARSGSGLNPAAPDFLPHIYTDFHAGQLQAFRQFNEYYEAEVGPRLARAQQLVQELVAIENGDLQEGYLVSRPHSCLRPAFREVLAYLGWYEKLREWAKLGFLITVQQELAHAIVVVEQWLQEYSARVMMRTQAALAAWQAHQVAAAQAAGAAAGYVQLQAGAEWQGVPGAPGPALGLAPELLQQQLDDGEEAEDALFGQASVRGRWCCREHSVAQVGRNAWAGFPHVQH
eukprot:scaffold22.g6107.t1